MLDKYLDALKEADKTNAKVKELKKSLEKIEEDIIVERDGIDIAQSVIAILGSDMYEIEAKTLRNYCASPTEINDETVSYANSMLSKYGIGVNCDCILKDGDYSGTVKIFDISIANFFK